MRIRRGEHLPSGRCELRVRPRARNRAAGNHGRGTRGHGGELLMKQHSAPIHSARLRAPSSSADARRQHERGWTLIEMVLVIIVFGIVATIRARVMSTMFLSYFTARDITRSDAQARVAFERLTRELRQIRAANAADLDPASTAHGRFIDPDGNAVGF